MKSFTKGDKVLVLRAWTVHDYTPKLAAGKAVVVDVRAGSLILGMPDKPDTEWMRFRLERLGAPDHVDVVHAHELPDHAAVEQRLNQMLDVHLQHLVAAHQRIINQGLERIERIKAVNRNVVFQLEE